MILKLKEELTNKELRKFMLSDTIKIDNFYGYQYALCLCGIYKNDFGKYAYSPDYIQTYVGSEVTPNQIISFVKLHKDMVLKEKSYVGGRLTTIYYILYVVEEKPTLINDLNYYNKNRVDIEIILNENGYYRAQDLHLEIEPYTSIIQAIQTLFSNENEMVLSLINKTNNNQYAIDYYDELGHSKTFVYQSLINIFDRITSIRLIGCKEVFT